MPHQRTIRIQSEAPEKSAWGAPCNGCGVCCLSEPCPLGALLSLSRKGPCKALQWSEVERQYRCGALGDTAAKAGSIARLRTKLVARWIAAGSGCDCDLEVAASRTMPGSDPNDTPPSHD